MGVPDRQCAAPRRALDWERVPGPEDSELATALSLGLRFLTCEERWTPEKNNLTCIWSSVESRPLLPHPGETFTRAYKRKRSTSALCATDHGERKPKYLSVAEWRLVVGY